MKWFFQILFLCQVTSSVKHSLEYFFTASSGLKDFPDFVVTAVVDDILVGYCDSHTKMVEPKQEWMKQKFQDEPQHLEWCTEACLESQPNYFSGLMLNLKKRLNETKGVHILQRLNGCEWDDETGEINGFNQYGFDGEDFISFSLETETWIAPHVQAVLTKLRWDADEDKIRFNVNFMTEIFPSHLKKYVDYGRSFLLRTELPSVSLLQKTPSSPVSCHATGFFPNRAALMWRKDGEELHEEVDHGEILPNQDGTFQMSADLDLSSVPPGDWGKYDCVFQLHGVKEDMVTRLEKEKIRSNWGKTGISGGGENPTKNAIVIASLTVVVLIAVIAGSVVFFKRRAKSPECTSETTHELSESLNPGTR